jgi:hypothetical protein
MKMTRRAFVERAASTSVLSLSFKVGGVSMLLTPAQARAQDVPLQNLDELQAARLNVLADALLPGAAEEGVVQFIDHQLGVDPNEALLLAKYFEAPLPYVNFYAGGIHTAASMAEKSIGKNLEDLNAEEAAKLAGEMSVPDTVVDGYPVFLFYMCLRSDAVDVFYGTPEGFAKLNIPYMQHILPPEGWNG